MAGFKDLTVENWQERDPTNEIFHHLDRKRGGVVQTSGDDWAGLFLAVQLDGGVPEDVQNLFAVARGTMLYGHYFYPLYTVGDEQIHRVADAATRHRYEQLGGAPAKSGKPPPFAARIRWLIEHGAMREEERQRWAAYRELRNISSHPEMQMLHTPADALRSLTLVARSVNALFRPPVLSARP